MIALDLSRLLSRAGRGTPTGIDRVEFAYARHLMDDGRAACFTALAIGGRIGLVPASAAAQLVTALGAAWRIGSAAADDDRQLRQIARRVRLALLARRERAVMARLQAASTPAVYLLVSHHHLER